MTDNCTRIRGVFVVAVSSLEYSQAQLARAIQQAYDLDSPPVLTIENIGTPTANEATTQVCCVFGFFKQFYSAID